MSEAIRQGDIPGVQLRCRRALRWTPEDTWPLLTEASSLERWLCGRVEVEATRAEWSQVPELEPGFKEVVSLTSSREPQGLVLSLSRPGWTVATRLEFELFEKPDGCELSVLHNGFEHLPLSLGLTVWETYRRRWRAALERLAAL